MQQTFISYSNKDQATAIRVCDGLEVRGVKCWISCRDVCPGRNYQEEITLELVGSSVMILIWSANANSSTEIPNEIALAAKNDVLLIPLKIDNATPSGAFEYNLATKQWTDLFPDFEKSLDRISEIIRNLTAKHNEFEYFVRESFDQNNCIVNSKERAWLVEEGIEKGLTEKRVEKIIDSVIGSPNNQQSEEEYLKLIDEVLEDLVVSAIEKKQLEKKSKNLGISDFRAQELLTQAKKNLGICDAPITDNVKNNSKLTVDNSKYSQQNSEDDYILSAKAQILCDPDLDTTLTDNNTTNNTLTEESVNDSEEDFEEIPAANTTIDKTKSSQTKNQFIISGKMHVNTLKKQFKSLFGLTLRIYDGRSSADEKATIANIRKVDNKGGEYSPGNNTKLVTIENKMMEVFGLKIQIYGSDDSYSCNRELTLKQAKIEDDKKIERKELKNIKAKDTKD